MGKKVHEEENAWGKYVEKKVGGEESRWGRNKREWLKKLWELRNEIIAKGRVTRVSLPGVRRQKKDCTFTPYFSFIF